MSSDPFATITPPGSQAKTPEKKGGMIKDDKWRTDAGFGYAMEVDPQKVVQAPINGQDVAMPLVAENARPKIKKAEMSKGNPPLTAQVPQFDMDFAAMFAQSPTAPAEQQKPAATKPTGKQLKIDNMSWDMGLMQSFGEQASQVAKIIPEIPATFVGTTPSREAQELKAEETRRKIRAHAPEIALRRRQASTVLHTAQRVENGPDRQDTQTFKEKLGKVMALILPFRQATQAEASGKDKGFKQRVVNYDLEAVRRARQQKLETVSAKGKRGPGATAQNAVNASRGEMRTGAGTGFAG